MRPWIQWISRSVIAIAVIAALLALPVVLPMLPAALPKLVTAVATRVPPLSLGMIIVIAIEAALILLVMIWWLWWQLPQRQVARLELRIHDAKARADTEDNFRKTVGQALGGAAVLIGAVVAYLQFNQQQQAAHDLLISNQVAKGFEQLAGDKVAMRLGGVYALEGVMKTSTDYYQPVLEALCAFVRDGTIGMIIDKEPTTDIQATLTVIARHGPGAGRVDLRFVRIQVAHLSDAHLTGADLSNANLNLADLSEATLGGANLNFANLSGADLSLAHLSYATLTRAHLSGADLSGAVLKAAGLSYADLTRADLSGTDLSGANLRGADLSDANLFGAHLSDADLSDAKLSDADLGDADLSGVHLDNQEQLSRACGRPKVLPEGFTLDRPCPPEEIRAAPVRQ